MYTVPPFVSEPEYVVEIETVVSGGEKAEAFKIGENVTMTSINESARQFFFPAIVSHHPICE